MLHPYERDLTGRGLPVSRRLRLDSAKVWLDFRGRGASVKDRLRNTAAGTVKNAVVERGARGRGKGRIEFDGVDEYIGFGDVRDVGALDFAWEVWFQRANTTDFCVLLSKGGIVSDTDGYEFGVHSSDYLYLRTVDGATEEEAISTRYVWDTDVHHAVVVADRSAGTATFYLDGTAAGSGSVIGESSISNGADFLIGKSGNGNIFMPAQVLTVRQHTGTILTASAVKRTYEMERRFMKRAS